MILIGSLLRYVENYPQTLLEECKYEIRKSKSKNLINDELNLSSSNDNEYEDESDDGSDDESDDKHDGKSSDKFNDKFDDESSDETTRKGFFWSINQ